MSHHQVLDLYVDQNDAVWCALQRGGVNVISNDKVKRLMLPELAKTAMVQITGNQKNVFTAAENGSVYKAVGDSALLPIHTFGNTTITDLCFFEHQLLVSTKEKGIWIYRNDQMELLSNIENVTAISCKNDTLWVGSGQMLYSLNMNNKSKHFEVRTENLINDIFIDENNDVVWLSLYSQ